MNHLILISALFSDEAKTTFSLDYFIANLAMSKKLL